MSFVIVKGYLICYNLLLGFVINLLSLITIYGTST